MKKVFAITTSLFVFRFFFSVIATVFSFLFRYLYDSFLFLAFSLDETSLLAMFLSLLAINSISALIAYFIFKMVALNIFSKEWLNGKTLIISGVIWICVGLLLFALGCIDLYSDSVDLSTVDSLSNGIPYIALGIKTLCFPCPEFVRYRKSLNSTSELSDTVQHSDSLSSGNTFDSELEHVKKPKIHERESSVKSIWVFIINILMMAIPFVSALVPFWVTVGHFGSGSEYAQRKTALSIRFPAN